MRKPEAEAERAFVPIRIAAEITAPQSSVAVELNQQASSPSAGRCAAGSIGGRSIEIERGDVRVRVSGAVDAAALRGGSELSRAGAMILDLPVRSGLRILVVSRPVDFRRGMDSLSTLVKEPLAIDPFAGDVFVFRTTPVSSRDRLAGRAPMGRHNSHRHVVDHCFWCGRQPVSQSSWFEISGGCSSSRSETRMQV